MQPARHPTDKHAPIVHPQPLPAIANPEERARIVQELHGAAPRPDAEARMKAHVAQLRRELNAVRESVSVTAPDLVGYCQAHAHEDPLVSGFRGKKNPWADEKRCTIL